MDSMGISSCQGKDFEFLWSAVIFEEAFRIASCRCEVTKAFVHPVSPGSQLRIKGVTRAINLVDALLSSKARTKLREQERNSSESISVFSSLVNLSLMESSANGFLIKRWFTAVTHWSRCLTAIGVIIESLLVQSIGTAWGLWESNRQGNTSFKWNGVRELSSLEENNFFLVLLSHSSVSSLSKWE